MFNLSERRQQFFSRVYWKLEERWVGKPYLGWRRWIQRQCNELEHAHPFFPWWLLSWLSDHNQEYCWAQMVLWKLYGDERTRWRRTEECRADCAKDGCCYCGKFMTPEYRAQQNAAPIDGSPF